MVRSGDLIVKTDFFNQEFRHNQSKSTQSVVKHLNISFYFLCISDKIRDFKSKLEAILEKVLIFTSKTANFSDKNAFYQLRNCYFYPKNDQFGSKMPILNSEMVIFISKMINFGKNGNLEILMVIFIPKMINFSQKCLFQQFLWFPAQLMSTPLNSDDLSS